MLIFTILFSFSFSNIPNMTSAGRALVKQHLLGCFLPAGLVEIAKMLTKGLLGLGVAFRGNETRAVDSTVVISSSRVSAVQQRRNEWVLAEMPAVPLLHYGCRITIFNSFYLNEEIFLRL